MVNLTDDGTFTFSVFSLEYESAGSNKKHLLSESKIIIKSDLSISISLGAEFVPILTQNLSSQSIPSIKTDGYQQNLTIGNGLEIKNGVLKTNIPPLPSDASTKTYTLKSVNGVLTWSE